VSILRQKYRLSVLVSTNRKQALRENGCNGVRGESGGGPVAAEEI